MPALRPVMLQAGPVPGGAVQRLLQGISPAAKLRRRLRRTRAASGGRAVSSKRGGTGLAVERFKSRPPSGLLQNSRILGPRVHPNIFTRGSGVARGDRRLCWSATDPDPQTERIPPRVAAVTPQPCLPAHDAADRACPAPGVPSQGTAGQRCPGFHAVQVRMRSLPCRPALPTCGHLSQWLGGAGASPRLQRGTPTVREAASCTPRGRSCARPLPASRGVSSCVRGEKEGT